MQKIHVQLDKKIDKSYDILIEQGLFKRIPALLKKNAWGAKYAIITDSAVAKLYGRKLNADLRKNGIKSALIVIPKGEKTKSLGTCEKVLTALSAKGFSRQDAVIALGGGMTGDTAGLVASLFMRGINLIHIPTTLIAAVDSSIGGKTGVNLSTGKNLAGAFYQPKVVLIDPLIINALPKNLILDGMAEVIKYSIISDEKFFNFLAGIFSKKRKPSLEQLKKIIIESCRIKADIVSKDEKEGGVRRVLNYGHTIGHAIEQLSRYRLSHGESITHGMILVNNICIQKGLLSPEIRDKMNSLLMNAHITRNKFSFRADKVWEVMKRDKKVINGKIIFVVPVKIGKTEFTDEITKNDFVKAYNQYIS